MDYAPVLLFVYNRPDHTQRTIEALAGNSVATLTNLYIFSDAAKGPAQVDDVRQVRSIIRQVSGFKGVTIVERETNYGLAKSIISGVSDVIKDHGRVIVLEDDLVTAPGFLAYMNTALDRYKDVQRVFSISGYNYPVSTPKHYVYDAYFFYRCMSWGWATWDDRWSSVDWDVNDYSEFLSSKEDIHAFMRGGDDLFNMLDKQMRGKSDSWAIRWCYAHFRHDAYCLYPVSSFLYNAGFDGSGVHCGRMTTFDVAISDGRSAEYRFPSEVMINPEIAAQIKSIYQRSWIWKILSYIKRRF